MNLKDRALQRLVAAGCGLIGTAWWIAGFATKGEPTIFFVLSALFYMLAVAWWRISRRADEPDGS